MTVWEMERDVLKNEICEASGTLSNSQSKLKALLETVGLVERRFSLIAEIPKRSQIPRIESEEGIDRLIERLFECRRARAQEVRKSETLLNNVVNQNENLKIQIEKKKRELDRSLRVFRVEEAKMKKTITERKERTADDEHSLVEEIKKLKMKLAQRRLGISSH
jgi:hypothetical protein